ncbi:IS91 family transposase [Teredinibacter purpureus]|jgi:Putative transposase.|uniref:IS91 family transposase n=1 Tax=Teredinibacter purpureus TaxID=2731756 RepID=UPI0006989355|nr:transposase [Teredinibacter purpureus]
MSTPAHTLQAITEKYRTRFESRYRSKINKDQWSALNAITGCRKGQYGELGTTCSSCPYSQNIPQSCGHRACNQCQYGSTQDWLERQLQKQLPVDYYMATFTLPSELRALSKAHRKTVYRLLLESATKTLKTFGLNKRGFEAELGMCAVLHTHSRRLDYHPHVHIVIPGGGLHRRRKEWRKLKGKYLFNGRALAKVFRGVFLKALNDAGLPPHKSPKKWIVQCTKVGRGKEALQYLSRYLYRGVIANTNIVADDGTHITFQYIDSKTKIRKTRTLLGEDFLYLLLQHVLPKGFRRARDYGFLHGNAKRILRIVQWILKVDIENTTQKEPQMKKRMMCPKCHSIMNVIGRHWLKPSPS